MIQRGVCWRANQAKPAKGLDLTCGSRVPEAEDCWIAASHEGLCCDRTALRVLFLGVGLSFVRDRTVSRLKTNLESESSTAAFLSLSKNTRALHILSSMVCS